MKKWEGYSLPNFVKICKNGHLLEINKNYTLYTKLNADFDNSISFHVRRVIGKNKPDFHNLRSIWNGNHYLVRRVISKIYGRLAKNEKVEGYSLPNFVKICKNGHLLEINKNYTLYTKLNADFDNSISFHVRRVIGKNKPDFHNLRSIWNGNHPKMKKWEGYSLPNFVKICKNGHLLEINKNYTLYTKLNADFDNSISFHVRRVIGKNKPDFHNLRSIWNGNHPKMKKWEGYSLPNFVKICKNGHLLEINKNYTLYTKLNADFDNSISFHVRRVIGKNKPDFIIFVQFGMEIMYFELDLEFSQNEKVGRVIGKNKPDFHNLRSIWNGNHPKMKKWEGYSLPNFVKICKNGHLLEINKNYTLYTKLNADFDNSISFHVRRVIGKNKPDFHNLRSIWNGNHPKMKKWEGYSLPNFVKICKNGHLLEINKNYTLYTKLNADFDNSISFHVRRVIGKNKPDFHNLRSIWNGNHPKMKKWEGYSLPNFVKICKNGHLLEINKNYTLYTKLNADFDNSISFHVRRVIGKNKPDFHNLRSIWNGNHPKMKKWEGYSLPNFVKICKNGHLLEINKNYTLYTKLNADFDNSISFHVRRVIGKNKPDFHNLRSIWNGNHPKMKKWEGYSLPNFVKICKNGHLLEINKNYTLYTKLNADFDNSISFHVRRVIGKNKPDFHNLRSIWNGNHPKMKKWEGYSLPNFVKICKNGHLLEINKNYTLYTKLNADFDNSISFHVRRVISKIYGTKVIGKNKPDFHNLRSIWNGNHN
ncbi:hypothetical protein OUZ56_009139 [Daphnia magna]|uniref:Uncharacterized protein n=1 Tax=Daphnia magna TaxID=35525 RepID=A0ABR0AFA7_9CRUS|nr:hypothetical protein OUZ56_009139 [Daphnia magna]